VRRPRYQQHRGGGRQQANRRSPGFEVAITAAPSVQNHCVCQPQSAAHVPRPYLLHNMAGNFPSKTVVYGAIGDHTLPSQGGLLPAAPP
jgi:hypothetical protein